MGYKDPLDAMMNPATLMLATFLLVSWTHIPATQAARFVCYHPSWAQYRSGIGQFSVDDINASLCTHLIYAYADLDPSTYTIQVTDSWADIDQQGYSKFVGLKAQNPNLKTMISLGGPSTDGSSKYSRLVSSSTRIATFVNSVISFLQQYGFDGLDLDWEFPTPADKTGYAQLIRALRTAFNQGGYLLSAAVTADVPTITDGYDIVALSQSVDFLNLMTYDMHGTWESKADHHAPLFKRTLETRENNNNVDHVVRYFISSGFPAAKLNLGIPLYGQAWTLSSPTYSPPAPASGPAIVGPITNQSGVLGYSEICYNVLFNNWTVVQDPLGEIGPYAYSPASPTQWVSYDDPASAALKSNYALSMGLGGAMVWDISTEDFRNTCGGGANPVMTAISTTVVDHQSFSWSSTKNTSSQTKGTRIPSTVTFSWAVTETTASPTAEETTAHILSVTEGTRPTSTVTVSLTQPTSPVTLWATLSASSETEGTRTSSTVTPLSVTEEGTAEKTSEVTEGMPTSKTTSLPVTEWTIPVSTTNRTQTVEGIAIASTAFPSLVTMMKTSTKAPTTTKATTRATTTTQRTTEAPTATTKPTRRPPTTTKKPTRKPTKPTRRPPTTTKKPTKPTRKPTTTKKPTRKPTKPTRRPPTTTKKPTKPTRKPTTTKKPTRKPTKPTRRPTTTKKPTRKPTTTKKRITETAIRTPRLLTTIRKPTVKASGRFACPSPKGIFPDPASCNHYFNCDSSVAIRRSCPSLLVFNPAEEYCDWPWNVPSCQIRMLRIERL